MEDGEVVKGCSTEEEDGEDECCQCVCRGGRISQSCSAACSKNNSKGI